MYPGNKCFVYLDGAMLNIRRAEKKDWPGIYPILAEVVGKGETYEPTTNVSGFLGSHAAWNTGRYRPVWLSWRVECVGSTVFPLRLVGAQESRSMFA